ncbi:unnamed protein product [Withania somnifera]
MVEAGKGTVFPVIFFDSEREVNVGNIRIQPTFVFKPFQLMISERIGISPNQISIYLCDRKGGCSEFEDRRRIPVTGKANFAMISREKNCFFSTNNGMEFGDFLKENLILLRRTQPEMTSFYDQITQAELASMNERVQNLQLHKENFDLVMNKPSPNPMHLDSQSSFPRIQDTFPAKKISICFECANTSASGETAAFHHCINDAVLVGSFRSRYGPVNRPAKQLL